MKIGEGFKNPLVLQIERWRDHIRQFIEEQSQPPCSGIFEALVLGEQGKISDEVKEHFILTGTAHLLAISGDQFGIVAFLSFSLLIWTLKRSEYLLLTISVKKWAAGLTIPCIILYAYIAGGGISVIRAMIMVIVFLVSDSVQSGKAPPSYPRSGCLSHPDRLASFSLRCLLSALLPCRPVHPLSGPQDP